MQTKFSAHLTPTKCKICKLYKAASHYDNDNNPKTPYKKCRACRTRAQELGSNQKLRKAALDEARIKKIKDKRKHLLEANMKRCISGNRNYINQLKRSIAENTAKGMDTTQKRSTLARQEAIIDEFIQAWHYQCQQLDRYDRCDDIEEVVEMIRSGTL